MQKTYQTLIINREAWKHLRNIDRQRRGGSPMKDESLNRVWGRIQFKNGGASSKEYPIAPDEIRVDRYSFAIDIPALKSILDADGFSYREDGFVEVGFSL